MLAERYELGYIVYGFHTKLHWDRGFSWYFGFPLSVSFQQRSILSYTGQTCTCCQNYMPPNTAHSPVVTKTVRSEEVCGLVLCDAV
jgi:hypothetical protein